MKITVESTTKIVNLSVYTPSGEVGIPARIWEGKTETGIPVHCYIIRIATEEGQDQTVFQKELQEQKPPSLE